MRNLTWKTERRKISDLVPLDVNPRKITAQKLAQLKKNIKKFNIVEIPVCDIDNTLLTYHQRLKALVALGRGEEEIDVRVPDRKLTELEIKEYNLIANTHSGTFDVEALELHFADIDFPSLGIDVADLGSAVDLDVKDPFEDAGIQPVSRYGVIVVCCDETEQKAVFEDLTGRGMSCKIVVT